VDESDCTARYPTAGPGTAAVQSGDDAAHPPDAAVVRHFYPATKAALHDILILREFAGLDASEKALLDETTCRYESQRKAIAPETTLTISLSGVLWPTPPPWRFAVWGRIPAEASWLLARPIWSRD
jgi:hypothetical protein